MPSFPLSFERWLSPSLAPLRRLQKRGSRARDSSHKQPLQRRLRVLGFILIHLFIVFVLSFIAKYFHMLRHCTKCTYEVAVLKPIRRNLLQSGAVAFDSGGKWLPAATFHAERRSSGEPRAVGRPEVLEESHWRRTPEGSAAQTAPLGSRCVCLAIRRK